MNTETVNSFTDITLDKKIEVVLLDFDNTCYLYEPCHEAGLLAVVNWFIKNVSPITDFNDQYKQAQLSVKKLIPTHAASHSRILYFKNMLEKLEIPNTIKFSLDMENLYWEVFKSKMSPVPGLIDFLAECRESGTKVVVISDLTTSIQCEKISLLEIDSYIDYLVTSEEAGAEKPDSKCFSLALQKVSCDKGAIVMIGDSYEKDIVGAEAFGISSILITHENPIQQPITR